MKTPKEIRGDKLIKILIKEYGFEIKGRTGSHVSITNGKTNLTIVLPTTSIGVFLKICRQTGIPKEEFLQKYFSY